MNSVSFGRLSVILVGSDSCRIECRLPDRNTDELLLVEAGAGDPAAFVQVYERHRDAVFRFAYRLSGSVELAEDITHDSFLGLMKKPENFNPSRASLRTYLFAAVRNLWLNQLRKFGRESAIDDLPADQFIAPGREPLRRLIEDELSLKVRDAVSSLPPLQREALILFDYEGLALSEVASLVGTDVGAVKARLHRARARLKTELQPYLNSNREIVTLEKA
jgi:RNA polymerase sigma-70 factor (ECF subfamily)